MGNGWASSSAAVRVELARVHTEIATCRACAEAGFYARPSPIVVSQVPTLESNHGLRLMLVGQAPASPLRSKGKPFSGQAGRVLFAWLAKAGFSEDEFRARCYFTAVTKCYPGPALPSTSRQSRGDRVPTATERALCRSFLLRELALIQPALILSVGRVSTSFFLGGAIDFTQAIGQSYKRDGRTILPWPHPSGVSRWTNRPDNRARLDRAIALLRDFAHER
jgi:uracil-DNA glycosylase